MPTKIITSASSENERIARILARFQRGITRLIATLATSGKPDAEWQQRFSELLNEVNVMLARLYEARLVGRLAALEAAVLLPCLEDVRSVLRRPSRSRERAADRAVRRAEARLRDALRENARTASPAAR